MHADRFSHKGGVQCMSQGTSVDAAGTREVMRATGRFCNKGGSACLVHVIGRFWHKRGNLRKIQQLRHACAVSPKRFRLAVRRGGVAAWRRCGVMSQQCSLCRQDLDPREFPDRSRRCRQCKRITDRMYRRARAEGYLQVYRMAAREDDEMQDLMNAFVTDNDFTFRNYFGRFVLDVEINARAARCGGSWPPPPPPGSPPASPPGSSAGQNAFGVIRVRVRIVCSGPFSAGFAVRLCS